MDDPDINKIAMSQRIAVLETDNRWLKEGYERLVNKFDQLIEASVAHGVKIDCQDKWFCRLQDEVREMKNK